MTSCRSCEGGQSSAETRAGGRWCRPRLSVSWVVWIPRQVWSSKKVQGQSVAGRVLVFPKGKGSTVGSYTLYRLSRSGLAPAAIINARSEAIVAVGAIMAGIPMVDLVDISQIETGDWVEILGEEVLIGGEASG